MSESVTKKIENNPEVNERASRRRFTLDYKSRIAAEAEPVSYTHLPSPRDQRGSRMPSSA